MDVWYIAISIVCVCITGYVIIQSKVQSMNLHLDYTTRTMEQTAAQLLIDRQEIERQAVGLAKVIEELDQKQKQVQEQNIANLIHQDQLISEREEIKRLLSHNKGILKANEGILKKNITQLFHLKESSTLLYDHYYKIVELSDDLINGKGIEFNKLNQVKTDAQHNLDLINNYFFEVFRMTVDQYKKEKTNIVAKPNTSRKNDEGLMGLITESSLN